MSKHPGIYVCGLLLMFLPSCVSSEKRALPYWMTQSVPQTSECPKVGEAVSDEFWLKARAVESDNSQLKWSLAYQCGLSFALLLKQKQIVDIVVTDFEELRDKAYGVECHSIPRSKSNHLFIGVRGDSSSILNSDSRPINLEFKPARAWRMDAKNEKFVSVSTEDVYCHFYRHSKAGSFECDLRNSLEKF